MTSTAINILTGESVAIPEPGQIVTVAYDCIVNVAFKIEDAKWERREVTGIVLERKSGCYDRMLGGYADSVTVLDINGDQHPIDVSYLVNVAPARSMAQEASDALEAVYHEVVESREPVSAADLKAVLAAARGALDEDEFLDVLSEKLSKAMPGFSRDGWSLSMDCSRQIRLARSCEIAEKYDGALSSADDDGSRVIVPGAVGTDEGQRCAKSHRKVLPFRSDLHERFSYGDDGSLVYTECYEMDALGKREQLNAHLADKLVKKYVVRLRST